MNFKLACEHFFEYSQYMRGYSKYTIRRYRFVLTYYSKVAGITTLEDISVENVRNLFHHGRIQKKWSPATFLTYYHSLTVFFTWAIKQGFLIANPIATIEKPRLDKKIPLRLSKADALKLLEIIGNYPYDDEFLRYRNHAIFSTFLFAGLRLNELVNLKYMDVNVENRTLFVRQGKGNKDRIIPMPMTLAHSLEKYIAYRKRRNKTCSEFFTSENLNCGFSESGIKRVISKLRKIIGLKFSAHKLRHTFATLMLEGGCDIYSLSQMMGHSDIKTTALYLHATAEHLKTEMAKHPLNNTN